MYSAPYKKETKGWGKIVCLQVCIVSCKPFVGKKYYSFFSSIRAYKWNRSMCRHIFLEEIWTWKHSKFKRTCMLSGGFILDLYLTVSPKPQVRWKVTEEMCWWLSKTNKLTNFILCHLRLLKLSPITVGQVKKITAHFSMTNTSYFCY